MTDFGTPHSTMEVLRRHAFAVQKKYGQNFLVDERVLERIIDAAQVGAEDWVLEIGPGLGTMTRRLAELAGRVTAVEIDRHLIPILEETLAPYRNVTVLNADILKLDIRQLAETEGADRHRKAVANLPYYITTPIVMQLLEGGAPLRSITVMVQREVADRMQAGPGTKDYGALSLAVQYRARPEIVANVPPNCFIPRPGVASAVVHLERYSTPPVLVADEGKLFALIRAAFSQRRKTLANSIANAQNLGIPRERVARALEELGLPPTVRGEALTLGQFAALSDLLQNL